MVCHPASPAETRALISRHQASGQGLAQKRAAGVQLCAVLRSSCDLKATSLSQSWRLAMSGELALTVHANPSLALSL